MEMFRNSHWTPSDMRIEVRHPYDNTLVETVPQGTAADIAAAVSGLEVGAREMRALPAWQRGQWLRRTAGLIRSRTDEFARTISLEQGKIASEARAEVARAIETLEFSAEEARRLVGRMIPLEASPAGHNKLGFTLRQPCGIVAAITPFNFPLNLVCHKVAPALAAGNAVLLKPASSTPLSALKFIQVLVEAGFPPAALACVTGPGAELGAAICREPRIRKVSFTGSRHVGELLCRQAGLKRLTMELGGINPVIVLPDADPAEVAAALLSGGYANAGQTCVSTQTVLAVGSIGNDVCDALVPLVRGLQRGSPLAAETTLGPLISAAEAERVECWLHEAVARGAEPLLPIERDGALLRPTVLRDVGKVQDWHTRELFGPAVGFRSCASFEEAMRLANGTPYGLAAAIFTRDIERAMAFAQQVEAGVLHVNWSTQWRADQMPYGGLKGSGFGKEGPSEAILEMTEEKMVVIHQRSDSTGPNG